MSSASKVAAVWFLVKRRFASATAASQGVPGGKEATSRAVASIWRTDT